MNGQGPSAHSQELGFSKPFHELPSACFGGLPREKGLQLLLGVAAALHLPFVFLQRFPVLLGAHRVAKLVPPRRVFRLQGEGCKKKRGCQKDAI